MRVVPVTDVNALSGGGPTEVREERTALIHPDNPAHALPGASTRSVPIFDRSAVEHFASLQGAYGEELPGFEQWLLQKHGIPLADNLEAKQKLTALFASEPEGEMYKAGRRLLERADDTSQVSVATAVRTAKEVLYAAIGKEVRDLAGARFNLLGVMGVARRFLAPGSYKIKLDDPHEIVGQRRAKQEARNLVDPTDPTRFITAQGLSQMTPAEIAALDIAPSHPMWHTEAHRRSHPHGYAELASWLDRAVTAELKKDGIEAEYSFSQASKVLFLDEIRESATSPKIKVEDAFGQNLGLKWGEECAIEPVVNQLMMKLGQKFCDVTENRVGANSPVLVLPAGMTLEQMTRALKDSKYEFNVKPHIQTTTVITSENADRVLANLPEKGKHTKADLIGRTVVTFKESMVEAKHDVFGRSGPVPLHTTGATEDRVRRGMQLAYLWLGLSDNKEDNHRFAFPKQFDGEKGRSTVAFMHDTGSALGGTGRAGILNDLHVDERFVKKSLFGDLVSSEFQLYRSSAWDQETHADVLWMANKIASLSQQDIRECAEASQWPDFMKDVMVYRLARRRDMLAHHFGLTVSDPVQSAPTIEVSLKTRADVEAAARRFGLDPNAIETALREAKLESHTDVLVRDGTISDAGDTVLMGLIRDAYHPTGLEARTNRREDGREYVPIRYGD